MKFIVIEGIDGSGKSTQVELIKEYFENKGIPYKFLHFPRTDSPVYGELVSMFLRGEFGNLDQVNPYLVALLYAGDRNDAAPMVRKWMEDGYYVLMDRYVNSNIAFQCAKLKTKEEKTKLRNFIRHLEYDYNGIPQPDLSLFLEVPFEFTRRKLTEERTGEDRDYLKGVQDIHESSMDFQQEVKNEYITIVSEDSKVVRVDCAEGSESMLSPQEIHSRILKVLYSEGIVDPV